VVWIDDTQDVVGTWRNFSLRGFLLFQWVTFAVPALCVIIMGSLFSGFVPQPYMFIVSLPPLIVLIAMGIDAAPRSATTAMGVLLVLGMAYYNVCALSDRGYGIEEAFKIIRAHSFDPSHDVIVYTAPDNIERTINHYRGDLTLVPVPVANKRPEVLERQQLVSKLTQGKDRAIVIYQNDGRPIGRMDNISPLRDWFNNQNNNWDLTDKWYLTNLEPINRTELRIFKFKKPETNDSVTSAPAN